MKVEHWVILRFNLFVSGDNQGNEEERWVQVRRLPSVFRKQGGIILCVCVCSVYR